MQRLTQTTAVAAVLMGMIVWSVVPLAAHPIADGASAIYTLPGDRVFPEGIAYQPSTGNFFVSSTTDGTIFRGNAVSGQVVPFLPGGTHGRTTAVGLKVDEQGRLFIAGGTTGRLFVYDTATGDLVGTFNTGSAPNTFINDVTIAPDGTAYFTDSRSPFLYKLSPTAAGTFTFDRWLDLQGTPIVYQDGFNLNGIAATADGRYLLVTQGNAGKLFRITIADQTVTEVNLGGETLAGDGLLLEGQTLYAVRTRDDNQREIAVIQLTPDFRSGQLIATITDPSFAFPTTIARAGDRLLVVNSQFDKRGPGLSPSLPFTVSSVLLPTGLPNTGSTSVQGTLSLWLLISAGLITLLGGIILRRWHEGDQG
jgi:sugar lactone lactonase YvrE